MINDWANGWANDRTNDWSNDGFDWWIEQEFPHNVEFISGNYVPQSDQLFGKHSGRGRGSISWIILVIETFRNCQTILT